MGSRILQNIWRNHRRCFVKKMFTSCSPTAKGKSCAIKSRCLITEDILRHSQAAELSSKKRLTHIEVRNLVTQPATNTAGSPKIEKLLQRIEAHYQRFDIISYDLVSKLIDELEQDSDVYNQLLTEQQTVFLLSMCGSLMTAQRPEKRIQLFGRIWKYLEKHDQLSVKHFLTALEIRRENKDNLPDFRAFLQKVERCRNGAVDSSLYEKLLALACENGDITQSAEILGDMRANEYPLTERVFNLLILGHSRNRDLEGCKSVLDNMRAANIPINSETQTMLICAYLENDLSDQAVEMRNKLQGQFSNAQLLHMLRTAALVSDQSRLDIMEKWLRELPEELLVGSDVTKPLKRLCIELIHQRKLDSVVILINSLPNPRFNPNQDIDTFGVFLLHELIQAQVETEKITEICSLLVESGKNTRALHLATEIAMRLSPPKGLPFLDILAKKEELRPHYFWPLLMYNFHRWGENGILRTLKIMSNFKVICDGETISYYVLPRLSLTLDDPERALKLLGEVGVSMSQVITPILVHILRLQKPDIAYKLTQIYPSKLDCSQFIYPLSSLAVMTRATKRYYRFAKLVLALNKKSEKPHIDFVGPLLMEIVASNTYLRNDAVVLNRLVSELHKLSLPISTSAMELIISHIAKVFPNFVSVETLPKLLKEMSNKNLSLPSTNTEPSTFGGTISPINKHPRDMSREDLECHLRELQAKRMNTRGVLRRLLQLCVRDGRLERALEVKKMCEELKVQISPGMMASTFDLYIKLKDLPNAEETLQKLKLAYPGFQIDEHKLIDYAALLVEKEQLESAKNVLKERAENNKIIGGDYVAKNVWKFLTKVAYLATKLELSSEENLTRETFLFLLNLRYCNAQNALLGPIVREYLLRNNIRAAVSEFRRLSETYKHTPLQFELLSLLVKLSNSNQFEICQNFDISCEEARTLLTTVTEIISRVHGAVNMNSTLLLALAESGTEQQLRRLLMDPECRINTEMLQRNCAHLSQEGAVHTLLRLARSVRDLGHVITEESIYDMLLDTFRNSNDYEAALNLYERLEGDDEFKISREFIQNLVNLLKANNIEIPSNVALRAQIM